VGRQRSRKKQITIRIETRYLKIEKQLRKKLKNIEEKRRISRGLAFDRLWITQNRKLDIKWEDRGKKRRFA